MLKMTSFQIWQTIQNQKISPDDQSFWLKSSVFINFHLMYMAAFILNNCFSALDAIILEETTGPMCPYGRHIMGLYNKEPLLDHVLKA